MTKSWYSEASYNSLKLERDELRAQVARLEERSTGYSDSSLYWLQKAGERFDDIRRLRAALEKYGRHDLTCKASLGKGNSCSCGLAKALQGKEPA